jgi:hypothetical protein
MPAVLLKFGQLLKDVKLEGRMSATGGRKPLTRPQDICVAMLSAALCNYRAGLSAFNIVPKAEGVRCVPRWEE